MLPSVVFGIEQEVSSDDGDTNSDHDENEKDEKHEAVDVVDLVGPEGREHEVDLDEYGAERQEAAEQDDGERLCVPLLLGYGPWHGVDAAWEIRLAADCSTQQCSD